MIEEDRTREEKVQESQTQNKNKIDKLQCSAVQSSGVWNGSDWKGKGDRIGLDWIVEAMVDDRTVCTQTDAQLIGCREINWSRPWRAV